MGVLYLLPGKNKIDFCAGAAAFLVLVCLVSALMGDCKHEFDSRNVHRGQGGFLVDIIGNSSILNLFLACVTRLCAFLFQIDVGSIVGYFIR